MAEDTEQHEKTEDATPRKRQEAREQGQVALSTELLTAASLCAGLGAMVFGGGLLAASAGGLIERALGSFGARGTSDLSALDAAGLLGESLKTMGGAVLLIAVPLLVVVMLVSYGQVGFQVTPKAIAWDVTKLDPLKGWSRLVSRRSLVRTLTALLKIALIATTMGVLAWQQLPNITALSGSELGPMLAGMGHVVLRCAAGALIAICVIAVFDFGYQRWQHESELKMTKKELKDEAKSSEGDPHLKAKIRGIQRELARRRMMADVPKATVVVTNPTHYAVALRYEQTGDDNADPAARRAPYVVAKGADLVAQRIKEIAREAGVVCYEDVTLARALHAHVEIGEQIPEQYYQAVASVLAYVYRLQKRAQRA